MLARGMAMFVYTSVALVMVVLLFMLVLILQRERTPLLAGKKWSCRYPLRCGLVLSVPKALDHRVGTALSRSQGVILEIILGVVGHLYGPGVVGRTPSFFFLFGILLRRAVMSGLAMAATRCDV